MQSKLTKSCANFTTHTQPFHHIYAGCLTYLLKQDNSGTHMQYNNGLQLGKKSFMKPPHPGGHPPMQQDLASSLVLHQVLASRLLRASTLILLWVLSTQGVSSKQFASRYWVSPKSCKWPLALVYCNNKQFLAMATGKEPLYRSSSSNIIVLIWCVTPSIVMPLHGSWQFDLRIAFQRLVVVLGAVSQSSHLINHNSANIGLH